jgi:uncharacterized protein YbjQ (UPF0145 family)
MRVSSTETIEGGRILYSIGTIKAASAWHAQGSVPHQSNWQESVIADLIRKAEDLYADAIIEVNYQIDGMDGGFGIKRQRILATAVAVKLSSGI